MQRRLFGLEAELAVCATRGGAALPTSQVVGTLARVAQRMLPHLPGGSSRMFLANGALFYVDCGFHPEWATPECTTPEEAVCHLRAGERTVARLAGVAREELKADEILVSRSNVDYLSGATWGCHESYLGEQPVAAYKNWLIPHLVSRIIYTGSGGLDPLSPGIRFSMSPRVAHIDHAVSPESTSKRGIFHTRDESLSNGYTRIHVLAGDNACSQRATWLKTGTTALIVALADAEGSGTQWIGLVDPVHAMKHFARDLRHRTKVRVKRGSTALMTATEIQRWLLARVEARAGSARFPEWTEAVCAAWKQALDLTESPAVHDSHALDWPLKFGLFRGEIARRGYTEKTVSMWSDTLERLALRVPNTEDAAPCLDEARIGVLHEEGVLSGADLEDAERAQAAEGLSWEGLKEFVELRRRLCMIDIRFSEVGTGIFDALDRQNVIPDHRMTSEARIGEAEARAPEHTRARLRGHWVQRLSSERHRYQCGWHWIRGETRALDLGDPFAAEVAWEQRIDPLAWRQKALEHYRGGRYADAQALLERLLETGFEPPDIHVHLARVCLMTDRVKAARTHTDLAWAARRGAAPYVVARTLWMKLALAWLAETGAQEAQAVALDNIVSVLGHLKMALGTRGCVHEWMMQPVLDHLSARLGPDENALLAALVSAMSGGDRTALQAIDSWQTAQALRLDD